MLRIRLCENMRAFGYVPFYFALATGAFADEGLAVDLVTSPSADRTGDMLLQGAADVSWGGPMRVMKHHQADPDCPLVCFAQVVARDPFVLVGREARPGFRFQDLIGLRVAVATDVPTPWLMFQDDLGRAGLDPASLTRADAGSMPESAAALLAGKADVVQVFEPHVDELERAGCHVWHRFSDRGDIAYTTFYATRAFIANERPSCVRLVRGINRSAQAFQTADATDIARMIQSFFPQSDLGALARIVAKYRAEGLWSCDADLPPAAFVRLKAALLSGGLISHDFPYDHIVDRDLSRADPH